MESLEVQARTVEEAIQQALEQLGVDREEVEVSVVKEGKSGILGLGADEAIVRVTPLTKPMKAENSTETIAVEAIEKLLDYMGLEGSIDVQDEPLMPQDATGSEEDEPPLVINVTGDDLGILIGRRGQTLASLQYIVRLIIGHQTGAWPPVVIDVEGYKKRRYQSLRSFAIQMGEQVAATKKAFTMEPMPAYERRIVHLALADNADITTESIGQGESRRVVIMPTEYD